MTSVIEIEGLRKTYRSGIRRKGIDALNGLDLSVAGNEIFGFLGPNGAGKTTTLKILVGLLFPSSGNARVLGKPLRDLSVLSRIGFLPESPHFYEYLTCKELLDFYCRLFRIQKAERSKRVDALLLDVGLENAADLQVRKLSQGMRQRLGIAQALINDPELIFLDEPMSGLDPVGRRKIRDMIHGLKSRGKTVFFSSHILQDAELLCDQVAIIRKGRLVTQGKLQDILAPKQASYEAVLTDIPDAAIESLSRVSESLDKRDDRLHLVISGRDNLLAAQRIVVDSNGAIDSLAKTRGSLEDTFIEFIEQGLEGGKAG
ncbi:MAG: ABC transporter ATP-binding protein [Candidatus Coatesbacteria bacterium]|nr:ABC transporter ATP-binding protein [Candidatus Coatesbacteria bacterium]